MGEFWKKRARLRGWKTSLSKDLGDFQTPLELVREVLDCLGFDGRKWPRVLEPTCGEGNFIKGLLQSTYPPREIQGIDIQEGYVEKARRLAEKAPGTRIIIHKANIFDFDLRKGLNWREKGSLLVVGNPPWATSAFLSTVGSKNLPRKVNLKGLKGVDAITGKSNFDIAEAVWLKLIIELALERPTIALLCKTSVARNVLFFAYRGSLPVSWAFIREIDAQKWFGINANACLLYIEIDSTKPFPCKIPVYSDLRSQKPAKTLAFINGRPVADFEKYKEVAFLDGKCPLTWRQGLKHDASSIMELYIDSEGRLCNKLGEIVDVEEEHVYPLLKSSDLFHGVRAPRRFVIVPQKSLNEDTLKLREKAPKLWAYLNSHREIFERRKSSVYKARSPFSLFGIGEYSFAPYKVAVSGLHKEAVFRAVSPVDGKPVMLDDTCYFVACDSLEESALLVSLLNDEICRKFISSISFADAKRPLTKEVLQRIDLASLYHCVDKRDLFTKAGRELRKEGMARGYRDRDWEKVAQGR